MPESKKTTAAAKLPAQWMTDFGIKPGEWQYMTKAQLLSLMRPCCPLKTQVWACGMLHSIGYQGELAVKMVKICGVLNRVPLTPADIAKRLHEVACDYYRAAEIEDDGSFRKLRDSKEAIRRALSELEDEGLAQRRTVAGKPLNDLTPEELKRLPSGKTKLFFFAKPNWGKAEIAEKTHTEALRALESSLLREKEKQSEVALSAPPKPSTVQILRLFAVSGQDAKTLKDPAYTERVSQAWEAAREIFIAKLHVDDISLPDVDSTCLPDDVAASVLPQVPASAPREVAASAGAFVSEGVMKSVTAPSSSSSAVSMPTKAEDEEPPAYAIFKDLYPRRRFDEAKSKPVFEQHSREQQRNIVERLRIYLDSENWTRLLAEKRERYIPLASNWLKTFDTEPGPYIESAVESGKKSFKESVMGEAARRIARTGTL